MQRVIVACLLSAFLLASAIGIGQAATQTATRSPVASPAPSPVISDYAEVGPVYDAARDDLLTQGHADTALLLSGETAGLYARLNPQARELITEDALRSLIPDLETDRVHFEIPQVGAIFDGHLAGRRIEGFFSQGGLTSFRLEAAEASATPTPDRPLDGQWDGAIAIGENELQISVEFATVGNELRATIDIPEQQTTDLPLANVAFRPTVELGELVSERALPASAANRIYVAEYAWGDASLAVSLNLDAQGNVAGLQLSPLWPLPPDPAAGMTTETVFHLPFDGVWWVFWGGETVLDNYHAATPSQRHAYDVVIWKDGGTHTADGTRNEDYWAWGQPALAPADGTVVAVHDGVADNTPGQLTPEAHPAGNHVVIRTAAEEFVFIAHFQQGSLRVQEGDQVTVGDVLGLTGNSGNSSEPHIHIHAQNRADFYAPDAIGLPLPFSGYLANGEPITEGAPVQGQFIAPG